MPPAAKGKSSRLELANNQMTVVPSALQQFRRNSPDAVVVLNHFGWNDALVQVLRGAVRERKPRVPLVFLSGYTPKFGLILN